MRLTLNNTQAVRASLARIIRMTANDTLDPAKFRTLCYGMSQLLAMDKHLDDLRIEERLDDIEQRLKGAGK